MLKTPKNSRLHIGIFGRRNAGKSSILNAITSQKVSIVSDVAGTTTDPVEKPMELLPLGPVLFIDTAGIDDEGVLGELRMEKTRQVLDRVDLAIIVAAGSAWNEYEDRLVHEFRSRATPIIVAFNKADTAAPDPCIISKIKSLGAHCEPTSATTGAGIGALREAIIKFSPENFFERNRIIADLVPPGECAVLVVPIDKEAPKGRIILPQVQTIRDLLDNNSYCIVVKENELEKALARQTVPPSLVVTDSQAFKNVAAITPVSVPLTSFSILFARFLADLEAMTLGAMAIDTLKPGDKILIAEACSHHPIGEDIGTVKIPAWLAKHVGGKLDISHTRGHDFPDDIGQFKLVIHCGACMWNKREMLSRILHCREAGVPITNYGLTIAWSTGIFERALAPFPDVLATYLQHRNAVNG